MSETKPANNTDTKPAPEAKTDAKPMTEEEKYNEMVKLYNEVDDYFLHRFMKLSHNHMDMKIQVLKERLAGKLPPEIKNWNTVQEID